MKLSKIIPALLLLSVLFNCKNTPADELIMGVDSLLIEADSINVRISTIKTDTIDKVLEKAEQILNRYFIDDSITIAGIEVIDELNVVYKNLDNCLMTCTDFNSELHFIEQQLVSAKELYKSGDFSDSALQKLSTEERNILKEINIRLDKKIKVLNHQVDLLNTLFNEIDDYEEGHKSTK